jgi:EAL domain-containing protein (putative c-di-GMP-specific phosphodiesterase class I)
MSFVSQLETDPDSLILCEAIILMAHKLGMKVIAEGIETDYQREKLTSIGCDYGQGYLISHPLPKHEFEKLLI